MRVIKVLALVTAFCGYAKSRMMHADLEGYILDLMYELRNQHSPGGQLMGFHPHRGSKVDPHHSSYSYDIEGSRLVKRRPMHKHLLYRQRLLNEIARKPMTPTVAEDQHQNLGKYNRRMWRKYHQEVERLRLLRAMFRPSWAAP